jgi:hypothetical protein
MLTYVAYYLQYLLTHFDLFSCIMSKFPGTQNFVGQTMEAIFFFGAYNVLICGVIGMAMLFVRDTRKLGLLGIFAAISFYGILHHIGDGV